MALHLLQVGRQRVDAVVFLGHQPALGFLILAGFAQRSAKLADRHAVDVIQFQARNRAPLV
ncbi:hypothetical protein D3C72_2452000 [compost metagenome]